MMEQDKTQMALNHRTHVLLSKVFRQIIEHNEWKRKLRTGMGMALIKYDNWIKGKYLGALYEYVKQANEVKFACYEKARLLTK